MPVEPGGQLEHVLQVQPKVIGVPAEIIRTALPTKTEVVNHALYIRQKNVASGLWQQNTPISVVIEAVGVDLCQVWDDAEIPNIVRKNPRYAVKKIQKLLE